MNHTILQAETVRLLGLLGWSHLHVRRSIGRGQKWTTTTNVAGWPDLFCWSPRQPGRFLAVEVKVPPDWLSDDQHELLAGLAAAGAECYVLTESPVTLEETLTLRRVGVECVDLFERFPKILRRSP